MVRYSVIMPLYNKAPYVKKALDSIVAQTYKDWELIIVDDGSTDNSLEVVKEFVMQYRDSNIKFQILQQANSGVAAARNNGVVASHGEFLCFLDADDWWEPTFIEEMDKLIAEYPDAGLYASNYVYYKPGKTHVALNLPRGYINYPESYLHSDAMPVWTGAACMPRKVYEEMGGFPVGIKLGEDFLLWAKTAIHYPVVFCEKPLAYYNNDVPASLRATRNLHAPENHMLFHLDSFESEIRNLSSVTGNPSEWKALLDKLRVNGLLEYWLDERYHDAAAGELKKVDWGKQPKSIVQLYKTPIWVLKTNRRIMQVGSVVKLQIYKLLRSSSITV